MFHSDPTSLRRMLSGEITEEQARELADRIDRDPKIRSAVSELLSSDTQAGPLSSVVSGEAKRLPTPLMDAVNRIRQQTARPGEPATESYSGGTRSLPTGCEFLSPPQNPDEIGRLGNYRILSVLGEGGMGMVFEAQDTRLKRRVALKTMRPEIAATATAKDRFFREAEAAAMLKHDNIVTIYQVDEANGIPFLAMEFLEGESLSDRLRSGERLPMPLILHLGREVADGLSAAHELGLVHRDIKPGNIWIEKRKGKGDLGRAKILDFGLARTMSGDVHLTKSGAVIGTPAYMSPEQARGRGVDHRADLFSLGVILYELTTGGRPFTGPDTMAILSSLALDNPPPPRDLNPAVMPSFSNLIMKLLAKDVNARPNDATEVAQLLRQIELGLAPTIEPMSQEVGAFTAPVPPPTRVAADPWADIDASSTDVIDSKQVEAATAKTSKHKPAKKEQTSKHKPLTGTSKHLAAKAPASRPTTTGSRKKWQFIGAAAAGLLAAIIVIIISTRGKKNPTSSEPDKTPEVKKQEKATPKPKKSDPPNVAVAGDWIDVIPLVDVQRDKFKHTGLTGNNDWSTKDGELKYSGDAAHGMLILPVKPIGPLVEVEVTATRTLGGQSFRINVPAKKGPVLVDVGRAGEVRIGNPAQKIGALELRSGIKSTYLLRVCRSGGEDLFEFFLDGKPVAQWRGDRELIANPDPVTAAWQDVASLFIQPMTDWTFHRIRVRSPADRATDPPRAGDYALQFDKGDKVEIPGLKIDRMGDVTLEAYITPSVGVYPLNVNILGVDGQITLNVTSDQWYFYTFHNSTTAPGPLVAGKRVHVAGVRTAGKRHLFIDGKLAASIDDTSIQKQDVAAMFQIGGSSFTGLVDEVRVSKVSRYPKDFPPPGRHDFDYNTLALYHFDEGADNVLKDSSGNKLDGKISGAKWVNADGSAIKAAVALPPPAGDYALRFNGNSYVEVNNLKLDKGAPITIEAIVNHSSFASTQSIVEIPEVVAIVAYQPWNRYVAYSAARGDAQSNTVKLGQRTHLAVVVSNEDVQFYIDGVPTGKESKKLKMPSGNLASLRIGNDFDGIIDELRVSQSVRYDRQFVPPSRLEEEANTIALYHCDEGNGDVLKDSSGNDHHGKIVKAQWVNTDGSEIAAIQDGFTSLFNGKDLSGWTTAYGGTGEWKVEYGAITCVGQPSYLYSKRGDYSDFHLRVEARVNDDGNSGVFFRVDNPLVLGQGYEAQVSGAAGDKQRTGSLHQLVPLGHDLVAPFEWFTMDIIAQGPKIEIRVNGKNACGYTDQKTNRLSGFLALQHFTERTKVFFRKIEIKELGK